MKIQYGNKSTLLANPAPEVNKVTADNLNEIKASVNNLYDVNGWVEYGDTANTMANPQVLSPSINTLITIDGLANILEQQPLNNSLWQNNRITPIKRGDAYVIRLDFTASIQNSDGYFDLRINIGGTIGDLFQDRLQFPKGNNVAHRFSKTILIYTLDTFISNGGQIFVQSTHTANIWDKRIIISKIHDGR